MWATARMISKEIGVSEKTVMLHANKMERDGYRVKARIGRPIKINRELFMRVMFPGWREGEEDDNNERKNICDFNAYRGACPPGDIRSNGE